MSTTMAGMPDTLQWVACDLETTGLHPDYHHRVVEIGLVYGTGRQVVNEWSTLVCPERDIGASEIHGLFGADLKDAPRFSDIAGAILERIEGRLLVAHNARFDAAFLDAEMRQAGIELPDLPWYCTLVAVRGLGLPSTRLPDCCDELGLPHDGEHSALGDARACAHLLVACAQRLNNVPIPDVPSDWPVRPCTRDPWPRGRTASKEKSYLANLVRSRPSSSVVESGASAAYSELLDRVLEDRQVSSQEADELRACAELVGLSAAQAHAIHEDYLAQLLAQARSDGMITNREQRDLDCVSDLLSISIDEVTPSDTEPKTHEAPYDEALAGKSVCFTGELTCRLDNERITRGDAKRLATEAGLVVRQRVTRKLDLLVVADPDSLSGKARKARKYGIRIIAEPAFWPMIDVDVD